MSKLVDYVRSHLRPFSQGDLERGTPHINLTLADLCVVDSGACGNTLAELTRQHSWYMHDCNPLDGADRTYGNIGAWIGRHADTDAVWYIAACHLLGLADARGPEHISPAKTPEFKRQLALGGLIYMQADVRLPDPELLLPWCLGDRARKAARGLPAGTRPCCLCGCPADVSCEHVAAVVEGRNIWWGNEETAAADPRSVTYSPLCSACLGRFRYRLERQGVSLYRRPAISA